MATRLERYYDIPAGKTIDGMAEVLETYLGKFKGMDIVSIKENSGTITITCRTKPVTKSVRGITKRATGHDLNMAVRLYQNGNKVKVEFEQLINEGTRMVKAILMSPVGVGIAQLDGIRSRHNIPHELNQKIAYYLESK